MDVNDGEKNTTMQGRDAYEKGGDGGSSSDSNDSNVDGREYSSGSDLIGNNGDATGSNGSGNGSGSNFIGNNREVMMVRRRATDTL